MCPAKLSDHGSVRLRLASCISVKPATNHFVKSLLAPGETRFLFSCRHPSPFSQIIVSTWKCIKPSPKSSSIFCSRQHLDIHPTHTKKKIRTNNPPGNPTMNLTIATILLLPLSALAADCSHKYLGKPDSTTLSRFWTDRDS